MNKQALSGVRIADFSWVWAGPYATLLLSFLGAEVIKIESRKRVDQTRQGSITTGDDYEGYDASPIFNNANLNKKSVSLDLKNPRSVELAKQIVAQSDVVIENMRPGVMDLRAGTVAACAILAAMLHHQKTGQGQYINLSSSECVSTLVGAELLEYSMNKRSPARCGNDDPIMAPHNVYRCKGDDKWISIAVGTDEEWKALCSVMGNPDWCKNEAYADTYGRWTHRRELDGYLSQWTIQYTDYDLMHLLQDAGVAAMPSFCAEEILSDPHVKARGKLMEVEHPVMGKGERYKMVPRESMALLKGEYGRVPGEIDREIQKKCLSGEELKQVITCRPADLLEPEFEKYQAEYQDLCRSDEDVLSCALFPQVAPKFLRWRNDPIHNPPPAPSARAGDSAPHLRQRTSAPARLLC